MPGPVLGTSLVTEIVPALSSQGSQSGGRKRPITRQSSGLGWRTQRGCGSLEGVPDPAWGIREGLLEEETSELASER